MNTAISAMPGFGPITDVLARNWWIFALRGAISLLFGLCAIFFSFATIAALVLLFGAYMLVDGVFAIASGVRAARKGERWVLLILEGLADIAVGVVAFFMPGITLLVLIALLGAWAVVSGVLLAIAGFRARHGKRWLVASGVLSVIWGVLLFVAPIAGALVLTWWLGGYAIAFGVLLLIFAFRLKRLNPGTVGRTLPA